MANAAMLRGGPRMTEPLAATGRREMIELSTGSQNEWQRIHAAIGHTALIV
jgi:hypothetical protein